MVKNVHALPRHDHMQAASQCIGIVTSVSTPQCEVTINGAPHRAIIATHIPFLVPGQQVALIGGGTQEGWLIIAAWPLPGQAEPPMQFNPATGTLSIQAARLNLSALAMIELCCGDAKIRLSLDGRAQIEGAEIVSAAIGTNRIEGASIDLN
jgi:hypothetical protein